MVAVRENAKKSSLAKSHQESRGLQTGMVADLMVFHSDGKIRLENKRNGGESDRTKPTPSLGRRYNHGIF